MSAGDLHRLAQHFARETNPAYPSRGNSHRSLGVKACRVERVRRVFLADDIIIGEGFFDERADVGFDILIGFVDEILRAFVDDFQLTRTAEIFKGERTAEYIFMYR